MREIYVVATESAEPVDQEALKEALLGDDVEVTLNEDGVFCSIKAEQTRVDIRFESRTTPLGWSPELLEGNGEAREILEKARGFYRVSFEPAQPQTSVAVFEALWAVRTLLELVEGVCVDSSAFKIHDAQDIEEITELDFDIRDHITVHAIALGADQQLWLHTHGLAKFGSLDLEMFHIREEDVPAAESFLHELATDMAFQNGPPQRTAVGTSVGVPFQITPSEEARPTLTGVLPEQFEGHVNGFLTVTGADGRHNMREILEHYRERFEEETEEEAEALSSMAKRLLPTFKFRFGRKGLMEPLQFLVRAPFEVHPQGEAGEPAEEQLWAEVVTWEDDTLVGKLVDGGTTTTEWRRGSHVEIDETQINAIAMTRDGQTMSPAEIELLLNAERPA